MASWQTSARKDPSWESPAREGIHGQSPARFQGPWQPASDRRQPSRREGSPWQLPHKQASHKWLGPFCVRLMQLRPDLSFPSAVQRAVATYAHASDWDPQEAAEFFVENRPTVHTLLRAFSPTLPLAQ